MTTLFVSLDLLGSIVLDYRQGLGPVYRRVRQRDVRRHSDDQQSDKKTRRVLYVRGE